MIWREKGAFIRHLPHASERSCFALVALFNSHGDAGGWVSFSPVLGRKTLMLRRSAGYPRHKRWGLDSCWPLTASNVPITPRSTGAMAWNKITMGAFLLDCSQSNRDGQTWKATRSLDKMQMLTVIRGLIQVLWEFTEGTWYFQLKEGKKGSD